MLITVPSEPEPVALETGRTALVVVDMQNAFCKPGGMFDLLGLLDEAQAKRAVAASAGVVESSRRRGIRAVFLRTVRPAASSPAGESPHHYKSLGMAAVREHPEWEGRFLAEGGWDGEIIDELRPQPEDIVVEKSRYSGFAGTRLDDVLKERGARHLVFIGVATNVCVESTLRDAYFHDYFPLLISDACASIGPEYTQAATLWNVTRLFGWVATAASYVKALDSE